MQQIPRILQTRWKRLLTLQRSEGKYETYPPTKDTNFNHILKTLPQDHTKTHIQHHNHLSQYQRTAKSYFIFVVSFYCSSPLLSLLCTQFSALLLLAGLRRAAFFRALQPPRPGEWAKVQARAVNQRVQRRNGPSPGAQLHPKAECCQVLSICEAPPAGRHGGSLLAS